MPQVDKKRTRQDEQDYSSEDSEDSEDAPCFGHENKGPPPMHESCQLLFFPVFGDETKGTIPSRNHFMTVRTQTSSLYGSQA